MNKPNITVMDHNVEYAQKIKKLIISNYNKPVIKIYNDTVNFLKYGATSPADLFIINVNLKDGNNIGFDGRTLCGKLPYSCVNVPILFITGFNTKSDFNLLKYNCYTYDFFEKSQDDILLLNRISVLLKIKSFPVKSYNNLSGIRLRDYWKSILLKDRSFVTSFISETRGVNLNAQR